MKVGFLYPEFQCPYCGVDIEDKGSKILRRIVFENVKQYATVTCGNCGDKMHVYYNDMDGVLVAYRRDAKK